MPPSSVGPLEGIKVLELGSFIAGPFAGQLLGDYGADVIKVEPPDGGDPMRTWGVTSDGHGLWWPTIGRNKRSVVADLHDEADRGLVRRIAAEADVAKTNNIGPDVVIEAVGSIPTYEASVALVRRGGRILAYGAAPQDASMQLRPFDIYAKELTIVGSYAGTYDTWPRAINLIAAGRFNPALIVDSIRPLSEAVAAIKSLENDRSIVKIHIQIP